MPQQSDIFLGRRPIIAADRRLVAWDLAFGNGSGVSLTGSPALEDETVAALTRVASTADWESLLCGARALIGVDRPMLFSDAMEKLPRNRIWLGLGPCDEIDPKLSQRLHALHRHRGTRLIFLNYGRRDPREQLLELADAVEIDARSRPAETWEPLARRARRRQLDVMVRGVDHDADFVAFREAGFDLMEGQCCAEASASGETAANADGKILLELLLESNGDLEISSVAERIGSNAQLTHGLLRLVNSLELARAQKIESISQALMMIGAQGLRRWLNLLLFQIGTVGGHRGPLFRIAASRARLMELLTRDRIGEEPDAKDTGEQAFLVGILSLVHVLLGTGRSAAIEGLSLRHELQDALTEYAGWLGGLLRLVECLDSGRFPEAAATAEELELDPVRVLDHQYQAYQWVLRMITVEVAR
ncbi:MAG: EAL and HDOD domain-containing protein [bacterium]